MQHLELAEEMPYWEYVHNDNAHPRPYHVKLNGTIHPASDPFWRYYYPIKAYGCHCTVVAHSEADLKHYGKTVSDPVEIEMEQKTVGIRSGNPRTITQPKGYDAGFVPHNFENLKAGRLDSVDKMLMQKMIDKDLNFTSKSVGDLLNQKPILKLHQEAFDYWVREVATADKEKIKTIENTKLLGVLPVGIMQKLTERQLMPKSAVIATTKGDVLHGLREIKQNNEIAVPLDFWRKLPEKLLNPDAILWEKQQDEPTLLFIYHKEQVKIPIKINYKSNLPDRWGANERDKSKLNVVVTGSLFKDKTGLNSSNFEVLYGEL